MTLQDWLLDDAGRHTAPGGGLLYATCSLLPEENEDRVAGFLARNPGFSRRPFVWNGVSIPGFDPGLATDFRASPGKTGTDGFYCAWLARDLI